MQKLWHTNTPFRVAVTVGGCVAAFIVIAQPIWMKR